MNILAAIIASAGEGVNPKVLAVLLTTSRKLPVSGSATFLLGILSISSTISVTTSQWNFRTEYFVSSSAYERWYKSSTCTVCGQLE